MGFPATAHGGPYPHGPLVSIDAKLNGATARAQVDSPAKPQRPSTPPESAPPRFAGGRTTANKPAAQGNDGPVVRRHTVHVEVRMYAASSMRFDALQRAVHAYIDANIASLVCDTELPGWRQTTTSGATSSLFAEHVERIWVAESSRGQLVVPVADANVQVHVYQPAQTDILEEFTAGDPDSTEGGSDDVMAASLAELPSRSLEGVWDSLIYADDIKARLLNYIYTTLLFSDANVNFNVVAWNRLVLLHGPPGTGKTTLCRALAQKLAIRLSDRYTHGKLVEINSHSLFSKWFSESGKLVQRLFTMVTEMVEDEEGFVVVLIDEVESLTAARSAAMNGSEPSDALRVVNALLTQLDKLKQRKNVLVMTTSNISEAIDNAFIDRADIKAYVGLPPPPAVHWILHSCLTELMRAGLVLDQPLLEYRAATSLKQAHDSSPSESTRAAMQQASASMKLLDITALCKGMSGRTLRRLPVLAHARHLGAACAVSVHEWLDAMHSAVVESRDELDQASGGAEAASADAKGQ